MRLIFADDLTGACDVAAAAGEDAWVPLRAGCAMPTAGVEVRNLETRTVSKERARETVRCAVRGVRPAYWKFDSLLRGNWAHELAAAIEAGAIARLLVAPAFPEQGRVMRQGVQYAHGAVVGDVAEALAAAGVPAGCYRLVDDLADAAPDIGETPAGSAGLARRIWGPRRVMPARVEGDILVVVGTASARGREQMEPLRGMRRVRLVEPDAAGPLMMAVERAARACRPSALVVVGGETLAGVARLLGFHGLLVRGETAPGMALAEVRGGPQHGSQIVTKAGDFGERETLAAVIAELSGSLSLK